MSGWLRVELQGIPRNAYRPSRLGLRGAIRELPRGGRLVILLAIAPLGSRRIGHLPPADSCLSIRRKRWWELAADEYDVRWQWRADQPRAQYADVRWFQTDAAEALLAHFWQTAESRGWVVTAIQGQEPTIKEAP